MGYGQDEDWEYEEDIPTLEEQFDICSVQYAKCEKSKVGSKMNCPWCMKSIIKKSWQHKFCCNTHKDNYWNIAPSRIDRTLMMNR